MMRAEQIDRGLAAWHRDPPRCPTCGSHDHTVWSCPVEDELDRIWFAEAMFGGEAA